jgi:alpha-ketoglutarate-dependent sulfate ester dioxygenase
MTLNAAEPRLAVIPATSVIGAYVHGVDLRQPLDASVVSHLTDALAQWKVLFFRNQPINYDEQIAFAANFGDVTPAHPIHSGHAEKSEIFVVESKSARKQFGHDDPRPRFAPPRRTGPDWHTDITFVANPAKASVLRGAVVPPYGGDTLWTNLVLAYEDLSAPIRDLVDHLQAVHRWHGYNGETRAGYDENQPPPSAVHPVVRIHPETDERALFVNPVFTRYLVGLSDRENRQILELLFHQIARPEFTVRFHWGTDTIAFWDNRSTAHLGPVDLSLADFDRRVERVTIAGDIPVGPDGFRSQQLRGELFG